MKARVWVLVAVLAAIAVWVFRRSAMLNGILGQVARESAPQTPAPQPPAPSLDGTDTFGPPPADTQTGWLPDDSGGIEQDPTGVRFGVPNRAWEYLQGELVGGGKSPATYNPPAGVAVDPTISGSDGDDRRFTAEDPFTFSPGYQASFTDDPLYRERVFNAEDPAGSGLTML